MGLAETENEENRVCVGSSGRRGGTAELGIWKAGGVDLQRRRWAQEETLPLPPTQTDTHTHTPFPRSFSAFPLIKDSPLS